MFVVAYWAKAKGLTLPRYQARVDPSPGNYQTTTMDTAQPDATPPATLNDPGNLPDPSVNFAHDAGSYPYQYRTRDAFGMAYKWDQVDGQLKTVFLDGIVYDHGNTNSLANVRSRLLS